MRSFFISLVFLVVSLGVAYSLVGGAPWESEFGTYWAATSLLMRGENIYDSEQLRNFCLVSGVGFTGPRYPPPFTAILLAPFTLFTFPTAAKLFLLVNLLATALAVRVATKILRISDQSSSVYVVPALFLPCLLPILFGQTSALVMVAVYSALFFAMRGRWTYAGMLLGLALLKPHLWSLTGLYLFFRCPSRQRGWFVLGGAAVVSGLIALVSFVAPESLGQWISMNARPLEWVGASPIGWFRRMAATPEVPYPTWPIYLSVATALVLVFWLAWRQRSQGIDPETALITLCLSCIFSPYLFFFDQCVLLIVGLHLAGRFDSLRGNPLVRGVGFLFLMVPWILFVLGMWIEASGIVSILGLSWLLSSRLAFQTKVARKQ